MHSETWVSPENEDPALPAILSAINPSLPYVRFPHPLGGVELSLYILGWIAWTPTYVVALWYL